MDSDTSGPRIGSQVGHALRDLLIPANSTNRKCNVIHIVWGLLLGAFGAAIAFDFRGFGIWMYDQISSFTPGGPPDPRFFTPDTVRILWGFLGVVGFCLAGINIANYVSR